MIIFRNACLLALSIALLLFSCKTKDDAPKPNLDKEIRIAFTNGEIGTILEEGQVNSYTQLANFNKNHYAGVDSIIVVCELASEDGTTSGIVELINLTDNVVISSGTLKATSLNLTTYTLSYSQNIYEDLPSKEITLTARLKSEKEGVGVICRNLHLFLYRK